MVTSYISRAYCSRLIAFSIFFVFASLELKAQLPVIPDFGTINHPIPYDLFGFNGANTLKADQSWNDLLQNTTPLTRLQDLNARVLRYPGGTLGNYWDWRKGWFLSSHDIPNGILLPEKYDPEVPTNQGNYQFDNTLETFLKCLSSSFAKPMWQMNLLTSDFSYQLAILYASKTKGVTSEYVELGNEFYLGDSDNRLIFPNVDHYAEKAMEWSSRIKSIPPFSITKIAALGAESAYESEPGRRRLWLGRLLENLNGNSDIDAITLHPYFGAKFTGNNNQPCPSNISTSNIRSAFATIIQESRDFVNDEIAQIANTGKETWITEFNLFDTKHAIHGTWFHGLFASSMLLTYLEGQNVTKIMPHTLSGDGIFSGMYSNNSGLAFGQNGGSFLGPGYCSQPIPLTREWELTALGNAVALITTAADGATSVKNVDFSTALVLDAAVSTNIYELSGWYFYKDVYRGEFILVNYAENPKPVDLDAILISNNTPFSSTNFTFKWQSLTAGIWEYALGNASSIDDPADNEITLTPLDILSSSSINLPPYSITRISINPTIPNLHVDLNKIEFCCHEMLNVRASNLDWSEGYYWSIDNEPVSNNDNPFFIEIPELEENTNKNITLHRADGDIVWTSDFLVNRCLGPITITSDLPDFCPGDQIHLTSTAGSLPNPWQYHWTPTSPILNYDVNVRHADATPTHTTMFRQYSTNGTCWYVSNDLIVNSQNPEPFFSKTELKVCNTTSQKNVRLEVELANAISGTTYTCVWKNESGTIVHSSNTSLYYSFNHTNLDQIFTVTVTSQTNGCSGTATVQVLGVECCQPPLPNIDPAKLNLTGSLPATVTNDKVFLNDLLFDVWNLGNPPPTIPAGVVFDEGTSVEINCTGANPIKDIYINRKLNVDLLTTLIGCTLHIGEEAEINLYGASDLVLMGCSLITCDNNVYTWKGATAEGENQMIVAIPFGGVKTYISNAEKAIDLSDKAEFVIAETDFFNNVTAVNLHDYSSKIKIGQGDFIANGTSYDINNIYDNTFNADNINWPSGFFNKGFYNAHSAISCSWIEGLEIGKELHGNDFKNSAVGIKLFNSSAIILNNIFSEIYQPASGHARFHAVGILSTYGDPLNDVNVVIGDNASLNFRNTFNDVTNSIVISGGGKYNILNNYFGPANIGKNDFDIQLYEIIGGDIEIINNEFHSVQTGIYGYNIYPSSKLNIDGNQFTDPELTSGNSNFRHTAITLQNQQQFSNKGVSIKNNEINNLRIGIHLNQTNIVEVLNNNIYFNMPPFNNPTEIFSGILTEGSDNLNIIDNNIISNNYFATRNDFLRGISMDYGIRNTLRCNNLINLGYSLKLNGPCSPSTIENNNYTAYDVGVYYASASVGNQGNTNKSQDNVWIPPSGLLNNNKVDGNSTFLDIWFHWGGAINNNFSPWPFDITVITTDDNNPHNANSCSRAENTEYEMDRFLASLEVDSQNTDADQQFIVAERLFRLMRNDSAFMAMNPLSYTQLSDLYYTFINSSSEYLNNVENYLSRQSNDSAEFLLSVVVDTNLIQENDKYIFEIICKVNNKDTLLLADTIHLVELVHSFSYRVGRATFSASALTFTERHPTATSSFRILKTEEEQLVSKTKIEPNPTEQCIWITIPNDSYKEYLIINSQGKEIGKINIQGKENKLPFCFSEGIEDPYLLLVGKDSRGKILDVNKVLIVK
ncbi:MAG: hypothetical protein IPO63_15075 [Bacteroidetes bacterium]|nr:hypothetical protein [Bacteroidota bacterium]